MRYRATTGLCCLLLFLLSGCTVKAVGDPKRPITIDAHITIDIKGLQNTAADIEDYVSGKKSKDSLPIEK
ncbi:MAG: hypothetical protein ABIJ41_02075 [Candidatus Omnitrophota bacterium]